MRQSTRPHFTLFEACARWEISLAELVGRAAEGELKLYAGIPFANSETGPVAGTVELNPSDILRMARGAKEMRVYRVKLKDQEDSGWIFIEDEDGGKGITITIDDLFIVAEEYRAFEDRHDLGPPRRAGGAGQSKHDWEGMFVALCKRVFEDGLPGTKEDLCREMETFFHDRGDESPDISTIRKKISPLWDELRSAV